MSGLLVLVGVPFLFGVALSLFHHENGRFSFVGLANFSDILSSAGSEGLKPGTLPYGLLMTVAWTFANVSLHLGFGLFFALMLRRVSTGAARIYRVLLIIPWAVPSYLTALIFRSMFDPDTGAINRLLGLNGFSWMHQTGTAFLANLITNVWLGVPFMMVVCLGALTSIPEDIYEAAEVDGASRARQFWRLTLPLLRPALLPSVILGSIWTFNKFEIIYLVSEGRPDGATDILVTESYRWAFERGLAQGGAYGYAAAYSVVIFGVLLLYSWMTSRVAKAAEDALR
jgi:arabinogalactan oligomer/maltooligosaccharide transport system permease protein